MKLTTHLLSTTPSALQTATTHPFLRLAGSGRLPKPILAQWLSQDRLYAQSYVRFIGSLLAKVNLPATPSRDSRAIEEKILDVLVDALNNIKRELEFFENTADEYGLDLGVPPAEFGKGTEAGSGFCAAPVTQSYIDMFMSAASPGVSLVEGLAVLWATEVCYLKSWRFSASFLGSSAQGQGQGQGGDADGGALREKFIPNWASEEFEKFVGRIGEVLDEAAEGSGGAELVAKCERWWRQVVWLEERFWPDVGGLDA
ncbi:hypothetical protein BJX61DRAFT_534400 [Aspergillus egyptiacus]|nr:hypothetical protein BJX61DRAFT_534400 [Aspergillus egyptiacus]